MKNSSCDMIIDMQYGSTGKGLAASYLCHDKPYDVVVSANMPNAGHTAYDLRGIKFINKVLPSGIFNKPKFVMIGPGAVFDQERLNMEVLAARNAGHLIEGEVLIHGQATVLKERMKIKEQQSTVTGIASTAQGSAVAMVERIMRDRTNPVVARDCYYPEIRGIRVVSHKEWLEIMHDARHILAEGAQGYSLGISQDFYPFTTSRDCTPARFMADMAIPIRRLGDIIGVCRTFPIRVGNTDKGHSGGWYPDQEETTWEQIGVTPETTTVTGRVRRVATFSYEQFEQALKECGVTDVFLNFANYLRGADAAIMVDRLKNLCSQYGAHVKWTGHGPKIQDVSRVW